MTTDSDILPHPLRWAVRLLRFEALAVGLLAVFLGYEDLTGSATSLTSALIVTGFAVAGAVLLWVLGAALAARRAAARAPAVVLQLMLFPVGYYMVQGGLPWLGIPLVALGATVCGLLVTASTARALGVR